MCYNFVAAIAWRWWTATATRLCARELLDENPCVKPEPEAGIDGSSALASKTPARTQQHCSLRATKIDARRSIDSPSTPAVAAFASAQATAQRRLTLHVDSTGPIRRRSA